MIAKLIISLLLVGWIMLAYMGCWLVLTDLIDSAVFKIMGWIIKNGERRT